MKPTYEMKKAISDFVLPTGGGDSVDVSNRTGERMCQPVSDRQLQRIRENYERLRTECDRFKSCLDELYSQENPLLVLQDVDLGLEHICDLVQPERDESVFTCSVEQRDIIAEDLLVHVKDELVENPGKWTDLTRCLGNSTQGSVLDRICSLTPPHDDYGSLCGDTHVHDSVEHFLNRRLENLQCTCNTLTQEKSSDGPGLSVIVGAAVGGFVLLLVFAIIGLVVWKRKKRALNSKRPRDIWQFGSGTGSDRDGNASLYSEISEMPLNRLKPASSRDCIAPVLPSRYAKDPTNVPLLSSNAPSDHHDNADYLEPLNPSAASATDKEKTSAQTYETPWDKRGNITTGFQPGRDPAEERPPGYQAPDPPQRGRDEEVAKATTDPVVCRADARPVDDTQPAGSSGVTGVDGPAGDAEGTQHDDDGYETLGRRAGRSDGVVVADAAEKDGQTPTPPNRNDQNQSLLESKDYKQTTTV